MTGSQRFTIVLALVAAGVAFPCLLHSHALREERERNEMLRRQTQQLAELSAENERLSILVAQSQPAALPQEQRRELLKLRGGIGELRQTARELAQLRAANQQLSNSLASSGKPVPSRPDPAIVLAYWPVDQLAPSGCAEPQSALKTFFWAMSRGDTKALAASIAGPIEDHAEIEEQLKSEAVRTEDRKMAESFAAYKGFYITGQRMPSENRAILDVFFEGD